MARDYNELIQELKGFAPGEGSVLKWSNSRPVWASDATGITNVNISAGTTSNNLSAVVFSNSNNVSFGLNGSTVTASASIASSLSNIRVSAGTTSNLLSAVTFADGGGVSFGLNASTLTATIATSLTNVRVSGGTTSNLLSAITFSDSNGVSFGLNGSVMTASVAAGGGDAIRGIAAGGSTASTNTVNFTNSNGVSFGFMTGASSTWMTASHDALTSQSNQAASASNGSFTFQTVAFSNANNVTFGTSAGSIITASVAAPGGGAAVKSYFQWPEISPNSSAVQVSGSSKHVQPIRIPYDLSVSYLRMPLSLSAVGSNAATATAANQTVGMTLSSTFQLAFYSLGVGANSRSLQSYYTTSHSWIQRITIQAAGVGSNWSSGHTISFPMSSSASAAFTTSAGATSASRTMNSSVISNFTALRFLDLIMQTSFSAGAYWFCYNSSSSISTAISNWLSTQRILASNFAVSQPPQSINLMNIATNSSILYHEGLGHWSTNSIGTTTASIALASLSRVSSNPVLNFQMIRQA